MADRDYPCPVCGSGDTRPSKERTIRDTLWKALFGKTPRRCRACQYRYFTGNKPKLKKEPAKKEA